MTDPQALDRLARRLFLLGMAPDPSTLTIAQRKAVCGLLERSRRGG
jgi:hypothetical protein